LADCFQRRHGIGEKGKTVKTVFAIPSARDLRRAFGIDPIPPKEIREMVGSVRVYRQRLRYKVVKIDTMRCRFERERKGRLQTDDSGARVVAQSVVEVEQNQSRGRGNWSWFC
jgi:hypothetical protein